MLFGVEISLKSRSYLKKKKTFSKNIAEVEFLHIFTFVMFLTEVDLNRET